MTHDNEILPRKGGNSKNACCVEILSPYAFVAHIFCSGRILYTTTGKPRLTHVANSVSGIHAAGLGRVEVSNKTWSIVCSFAVARDGLFSVLWVRCDHWIVWNLDAFCPRLGDLDEAHFDGKLSIYPNFFASACASCGSPSSAALDARADSLRSPRFGFAEQFANTIDNLVSPPSLLPRRRARVAPP